MGTGAVRQFLYHRAAGWADRLVRSAVWGGLPGTDRRFEGRLATARVLRWAQRRRNERIDTTLPGRALLAAEPSAIRRLSDRLAEGSILVSATNGKTTTTQLVASIARSAGWAPVTNRTGENMAVGVAAELVAAARHRGGMAGDLGVFEVDELHLERVLDQLTPRALLLGNLFRDQLDRYGELDALAHAWAGLLTELPPSTATVLCADDPRVASLGPDRPGAVYFGISAPSVARAGLTHAADPPRCPGCGAALHYDEVYVGHLGHHRCPRCGRSRCRPAVEVTDIDLHGMQGSSFRLRTPDGETDVDLRLPGVYNVYNAAGAAAVGWVLGASLTVIAQALAATPPAFGRAEVVNVGDRPLRVFLAKNPTGLNEVFHLLVAEAGDGRLDLLLLLNDRVYDGHDVSWIWDAEVEDLAPVVRSVVCGGTRAISAAVRMKYAGVEEDRIALGDTVPEALALAVDRAAGELFVVANYTAMTEVREVLAEQGHAARYWR